MKLSFSSFSALSFSLTLLSAALCGANAQAQTSPPAAAAPAASAAPAPVTPARQALVDRLLSLWHVEDVAVVMVQRPALNAMEQARVVLQGRVSAEKRERTLKDISTDVQTYVDEATPLAKESAHKMVGPTITPLLLSNFNDAELQQIIALLESPLKKKFEKLVPEMERALGEKVASDSAAAINPKLQAMTQAVGLKLRAASIAP
ncbi:DUF2059 domain-containing protein [Roseateles koreensis]|uniref:DUF2059 domain-containing protein n=1 Tax=Roseateles koreensis TaxID=2987526 RepID=A0ABT5KQ52_9BURK|nr:DUF2059 domain-containing protein [Roseateles koreensis]MDC8785029.1 DUF2059 domain-containing protein [Roseateles koreensis]